MNTSKEIVRQVALNDTRVNTGFNTPFNYIKEEGKQPDEPSMTVPDQSLTIKEILLRYAQGRPLSKTNKLVFTGDEYIPDLRKMDMADIDVLKDQNQANIDRLEGEFKKQQEAQRANEQEQERKGKSKQKSKRAEGTEAEELEAEDLP